MKKKMTKKQPINVQMSKLDLAELLNTLKKFAQEELLKTSKEDNARMDCIYRSLFNLEADQKKERLKINTLERQLSCGRKTGHHFTVEREESYVTVFRCVKCDLTYSKSTFNLNRKEKRLLRIISKG